MVCTVQAIVLIKARRFDGESRLLGGCNTSRQCNIIIGCKPHGCILHTVLKPTAPITYIISHGSSTGRALAPKSGEHGINSHLGKSLPHVCAHFNICGRSRVIFSVSERWQLQFRTAVVAAYKNQKIYIFQ